MFVSTHIYREYGVRLTGDIDMKRLVIPLTLGIMLMIPILVFEVRGD